MLVIGINPISLLVGFFAACFYILALRKFREQKRTALQTVAFAALTPVYLIGSMFLTIWLSV